MAAMTAGRRRWVERMRMAKVMGEIERFPGGRRPKAGPRPAKKRCTNVVEQARGVVANGQARLPILPAAPWQDQTNAEKLTTLTGKALERTREILELPCDPGNLKLLAIVKDAALSILSTQVRVDETQLRPRRENAMERLLERIAEVDRQEAERAKVINSSSAKTGRKS